MLLMMLACAGYDFDPPDLPRHDEQEDEAELNGAPLLKSGRHADLMDTPFLCRDPSTGDAVACPEARPADENLSCDASGCHGDFDYSPGYDRSTRHLRGSDAPSCYACHDREWSGRQE